MSARQRQRRLSWSNGDRLLRNGRRSSLRLRGSWGVETGSGVLWHWGDNGNRKNFVLIQPRDKAALVVFTNGSHGMNVAERLVAAATGDDHVAFQWL